MVGLIKEVEGIITDSGGIQEEAVCAGKKVLVCRDTTERPETIESGWGKLVGTKIIENLNFLYEKKNKDKRLKNPYGKDVCKKFWRFKINVINIINCFFLLLIFHNLIVYFYVEVSPEFKPDM